jgi:hypothetical protein
LQDEEKNTIQQLICTYKYIVEVRILILGNFWHIFSNINVMKIVETFNHLLHCCVDKTLRQLPLEFALHLNQFLAAGGPCW